MTEIVQGGPRTIVEAATPKVEIKGMVNSEAAKDRSEGQAWWQVGKKDELKEQMNALVLVISDQRVSSSLRTHAREMFKGLVGTRRQLAMRMA